ncbi:hypothetical protein L6475_02010 [Prevotella sp. E9-3]|uniref:hypothetical protein n=1 Tax=Prevotella sp. E9-3 TaxID=2913621 RepID=UPI001EDAB6A4|nr:hypothetical protein [Prevotella sp. E9-3]UKK48769.1 hypothetical protein L6475_02010 [Prevotella sp. E9-3]
MRFTVPKGWKELTQEQLRYVLRLLWLYNDRTDGMDRAKMAAFVHFCGFEVVRRTDQGWLCRQRKSGDAFLLDPELLPSLLESVEWIADTEQMNVRIEQVGGYKAVDFELQELPFGKYLEAENNFQSYLQSKQENSLSELARILYLVPYGSDGPTFGEEELLGAFLWFNAAKQLLGRMFPNFLKPASGEQEPVTQESLIEATRAQIRLLTKGDVTKQKYILEETDTWTAMAELDALAKEAEEIKRKYGK